MNHVPVRRGGALYPERQGVSVFPPGAATDEVHLWHVSLRRPHVELARLDALLSGDERVRADRFRFARDRDRFVAARGLLRAILAGYLDRDPADLRFAYGPHGKPTLPAPDAELRFNIAHAGEHALVAVGRGRELGIDLEAVRADLEFGELAATSLTASERDLLATVPPARRPECFASLWTRKEALAKAIGLGLALPFDRVDVAEVGAPGSWIGWESPFPGGRGWSLRSLDAGRGFAAALAVEGDGVEVRRQCWPEGAGDQ